MFINHIQLFKSSRIFMYIEKPKKNLLYNLYTIKSTSSNIKIQIRFDYRALLEDPMEEIGKKPIKVSYQGVWTELGVIHTSCRIFLQ